MYIRVLVKAGSKKELVTKVHDTEYQMSLREPAERNLANKRVIEIMRALYPNTKVIRIISGHRSPQKMVSVD